MNLQYSKRLQKLDIYVSNRYINNIAKKYSDFESILTYIKSDLRFNHLYIYNNLHLLYNCINPDLIDCIKLYFNSDLHLFIYTSIVILLNSKIIYYNTRLQNLHYYLKFIEFEMYKLINVYLYKRNYKKELYRYYNFYLLKNELFRSF
jgi:hypothetical protein